MATLHNGIFGTISGKIGSLVYYYFLGKQRVRTMPKKSNKQPSAAQIAQRMRLGLIVNFFAGVKTLIRKGYGNAKGASSGTNRCIAYHLKHAIEGDFPTQIIDYSKVVLTNGRLEMPCDPSVNSNGAARVNVPPPDS